MASTDGYAEGCISAAVLPDLLDSKPVVAKGIGDVGSTQDVEGTSVCLDRSFSSGWRQTCSSRYEIWRTAGSFLLGTKGTSLAADLVTRGRVLIHKCSFLVN